MGPELTDAGFHSNITWKKFQFQKKVLRVSIENLFAKENFFFSLLSSPGKVLVPYLPI